MLGHNASEGLIRKAQAYAKTVPTITVDDLQRQFGLGYTSAAELMDKLEELGDVGPYNGAAPRQSFTYAQQPPKLIDRIFKPVMVTVGVLLAVMIAALISIRSPQKEYNGPIALTKPPAPTAIITETPIPTPDNRFDNLTEILGQIEALYTPLVQVDSCKGTPTATSLSVAIATPDLAELYTRCVDKDTAAWDEWTKKQSELVTATAGVVDVMEGFEDGRRVMVQFLSADERVSYFTLTVNGVAYDAVDTIKEQVAQAAAAAAAAEQAKKDREERIANNSASQSAETKYILNTNSKVFHRAGCDRADNISSDNRRTSYSSRSSLIEQGYTACGSCNP